MTPPNIAHAFFDLQVPISIGHRGCAGEAPENTLASFALALEQGASILESDVQQTSDGVPVLIHDPFVNRVTNAAGAVSDYSLDELQQLDAGYQFTTDDGASHPFRGKGHRIPSLEQAFATFPTTRFNLELKAPAPTLVDAAIDLVVKLGREALTLLTAGEDDIMARLRPKLDALSTPIAQGACTADVLDFVRTAMDSGNPRPGPMALQIPARFGDRPMVTEALVAHAHAHGVQIHVWTINDPAEMNALLDLGADGLISDYPRRVGSVLAARS